MIKLERRKGRTVIDIGRMQIVTTFISRFRYNDLRKKEKLTKEDIFLAIRAGIRKKHSGSNATSENSIFSDLSLIWAKIRLQALYYIENIYCG